MSVSSIFRSGVFADKVAIVTGGGSGIGKAVAQELLYLGCNVVIAARNLDRLNETADELRKELCQKNGPKLKVIQCNIRKEDQVVNLISETLEIFKRLDFLVNNGGGQFISPASSFSLKGWNAVIETNLTGAFLCCREACNQWMGENGGAIVNMVANFWNGWPGATHSGAARAGVENITKSLAIEWSAMGIRINAVAPGGIYSESAVANYPNGEEFFKTATPRVPAKRLGTPEEVSSAICYLLSPAAAFINGETIKIDGAQSLYSTNVPYEIPEHDKLPAYTWETDIEAQKKVKSKL